MVPFKILWSCDDIVVAMSGTQAYLTSRVFLLKIFINICPCEVVVYNIKEFSANIGGTGLLYGGLYQTMLRALGFLDVVLGVVLSLLYLSTYLYPLLIRACW